MWASLKNYSDGALLFLRLTLGTLCLYVYGWPALAGGVGRWKVMGATMKHIGITFGPTFWGFMAACSESLGCLLLIIGFLFRPSCLVLFLTLLVIAVAQIEASRNGIFTTFARDPNAIQLALFVLTLMFIGPGKFSVDKG